MNTVIFLPLVYGAYWAPFIIFCITLILMLKDTRIFNKVPKFFLLLIGLQFVGVLSYFMSNGITATNFFRDFLTVLNIIFLYISGYWIGKKKWNSFVEAVKFASVCYSVFYLIKFGYLLSSVGLNFFETQNYRLQMGAGEFIVAIGLYFYITESKRYSIFFSALLVTVALLTQSRTMLIYLIILLFMAASLRTGQKQKKIFLLFAIVQIIFVSATILIYAPTFQSSSGAGNLIVKLLTSLEEILPAYHDRSEVGHFWRGFESYIALEVFKESNTYQFVFGRGMGYAFPLPYEMTLAGNSFNEIPFLHNGYASVLVKFGLVGLFLYTTLLVLLLRVGLRSDLSILYSATVLFTIFATLFMAGPFEKNDFTHVTLLLGALSGRSIAVKNYSKRTARRDPTGNLKMQGV